MSTGNRILHLLKLQNKTQYDLANYLIVKPATVSRYLSGDLNLKPDTLVKISNYFNVSSDYLLGLEEKTPNIAVINFEGDIRIYKEVQLSKEDHATILNIINNRNYI